MLNLFPNGLSNNNSNPQSNINNPIFSNYKKPKPPKIKYVCSLGISCFSASILKRNKLRLAPFPFDWVLLDLNSVIHSLQDNFNVFLDKQYYIDISANCCGHKLYNPSMFFHHNPLINEAHYQYFIDAVNRFRELVKNPEYKLFMISFPNNSENNDIIKQRIIYFNNFFKQYTINYRLLCLIHRINTSFNYSFTKYDNIDFIELYTTTASDGVYFVDKEETYKLDSIILQKYSFHLAPITK
jgi:hypothetical protein